MVLSNVVFSSKVVFVFIVDWSGDYCTQALGQKRLSRSGRTSSFPPIRHLDGEEMVRWYDVYRKIHYKVCVHYSIPSSTEYTER